MSASSCRQTLFLWHQLQSKLIITSMKDSLFEQSDKAKIVKEGNDLLLISFSKMVLDCLEVANKLENEGISIEVLDLRTVKPLDIETIKNSIDKIGKVIVVEEGFPQSGIAAEIIAQINEVCFYSLDGPIKRICTLEIPLPCSPKLENMAIPSKERIENEIRSMLNE